MHFIHHVPFAKCLMTFPRTASMDFSVDSLEDILLQTEDPTTNILESHDPPTLNLESCNPPTLNLASGPEPVTSPASNLPIGDLAILPPTKGRGKGKTCTGTLPSQDPTDPHFPQVMFPMLIC